MEATRLAQYIINMYSPRFAITNLKINKLLYFIQVEALRATGSPAFENDVEAWAYGPVVPAVYHKYQGYGRNVITPDNTRIEVDENLNSIVEEVMSSLASLTAYDLVLMSHKKDGAWSHVYQRGANKVITANDMLKYNDRTKAPEHTLAGGIQYVKDTYPNALRLLQNS